MPLGNEMLQCCLSLEQHCRNSDALIPWGESPFDLNFLDKVAASTPHSFLGVNFC